jgi:hypothetical protein
LECIALGIMAVWKGPEPLPGWGTHPISDLNQFHMTEYPSIFFVKPKVPKVKKEKRPMKAVPRRAGK